MRAVRMHAVNDLRYEEDLPVPHPARGEVLVRVVAAGVNPADWEFLEGWYPKYIQTLPMTLGCDVAGRVDAVGQGVSSFAVGDEVFGFAPLMRDGAYADYVRVPVDFLVPRPAGLSAAQAAALPAAGTTAWFALFKVLNLQAGQSLFIQRAAGGVGTLAVQLARNAGARVIASASAANHQYLKELGADEVIDYRTQRFDEILSDVDAVLESVGGEALSRAFRVLRRGGRLVSIMDEPDAAEAERFGIHASRLVAYPPENAVIAELGRLAAAGALRTEIAATFPLCDAAKALALSRAGHTRGKLILMATD